MKLNLYLAALSATTLSIYPALAHKPHTLTASTIVRFSDLDLSMPRDRDALDGRIRAAADNICNGLNGDRLTASDCINHSVRNARRQRDTHVARQARHAADSESSGHGVTS